MRAQTPPASHLHPRPGKEGDGNSGSCQPHRTSSPSTAQSMQEPSAESQLPSKPAHSPWDMAKVQGH